MEVCCVAGQVGDGNVAHEQSAEPWGRVSNVVPHLRSFRYTCPDSD
jgi:hypothetical protein